MMSIRELVAWVLVIGLVVTLVNLKMKVSSTSSKPSRKEELKNAPSALDDYPIGLEMTPNEFEEVRLLEEELDKEARADERKVAGLSGRNSSKQPKRRRSDKVRGSQDGASSVHDSKGPKSDGPAPHKGSKRKA